MFLAALGKNKTGNAPTAAVNSFCLFVLEARTNFMWLRFWKTHKVFYCHWYSWLKGSCCQTFRALAVWRGKVQLHLPLSSWDASAQKLHLCMQHISGMPFQGCKQTSPNLLWTQSCLTTTHALQTTVLPPGVNEEAERGVLITRVRRYPHPLSFYTAQQFFISITSNTGH